MEITKMTFKDITRDILVELFNLTQVRHHSLLTNWFQKSEMQTIDEFDKRQLESLQNKLIMRSSSWNEFELSEWFIGPVISMINFDTDRISLFAGREIKAIVNDIELSGRPDVMLAKGIDSPRIPYFCFHEYKQQTDPNGNPQTQLLGAMYAAQALNSNEKPVYGIYVVGYDWKFVVLNGTEWCESNPYTATDEELFDIFKILKALKEIILSY